MGHAVALFYELAARGIIDRKTNLIIGFEMANRQRLKNTGNFGPESTLAEFLMSKNAAPQCQSSG